MKLFCITLGLLVVGFSAAAGDGFVNFSPRDQPPFFPSKGLLYGSQNLLKQMGWFKNKSTKKRL